MTGCERTDGALDGPPAGSIRARIGETAFFACPLSACADPDPLPTARTPELARIHGLPFTVAASLVTAADDPEDSPLRRALLAATVEAGR